MNDRQQRLAAVSSRGSNSATGRIAIRKGIDWDIVGRFDEDSRSDAGSLRCFKRSCLHSTATLTIVTWRKCFDLPRTSMFFPQRIAGQSNRCVSKHNAERDEVAQIQTVERHHGFRQLLLGAIMQLARHWAR